MTTQDMDGVEARACWRVWIGEPVPTARTSSAELPCMAQVPSSSTRLGWVCSIPLMPLRLHTHTMPQPPRTSCTPAVK